MDRFLGHVLRDTVLQKRVLSRSARYFDELTLVAPGPADWAKWLERYEAFRATTVGG